MIIIIDGIHMFKDAETGKEQMPDWISVNFPKDIYVLVTIDSNSKGLKHFNYAKSPSIELKSLGLGNLCHI